MTWFAERPLGIEGDAWANLLTAARPNAFVLPGRCVKPRARKTLIAGTRCC